MRVPGVVLAVVVVWWSSPAPARAEMSTTSPMAREFARMGIAFWHDRGVRPCADPIVIRADIGPQANGATYPGQCRIWISGGLIAAAQRERWRRLAGGESAREELCATIFHELGHEAGLLFPDGPDAGTEPDAHARTGLMSATNSTVPWACHRWRLRADRAQRRLAD